MTPAIAAGLLGLFAAARGWWQHRKKVKSKKWVQDNEAWLEEE